MHDRDVGGYVADAQRAVTTQVPMTPGYCLEWSGQFEYLERAKAKLTIVVPITLVITFSFPGEDSGAGADHRAWAWGYRVTPAAC